MEASGGLCTWVLSPYEGAWATQKEFSVIEREIFVTVHSFHRNTKCILPCRAVGRKPGLGQESSRNKVWARTFTLAEIRESRWCGVGWLGNCSRR